MLAVFAFSAIASASASAHNFTICREGGTEKYETNKCAKKSETGKFSILPVEGTEVYKVTSTSGASKLEGTLAGVKVVIECKKDKDTGEIEKEGKSKNTVLTYEECELAQVVKHVKEKLTACTVANIKTNALKDVLITGKGAGPEEELEPESGTVFATIEVGGASCALVSKETVTGKQICALPEAAVEQASHELVCSPSGGSLEFGKKPASYFGTDTVTLENGAAWDAE
ncbi:MAG: hypothetical protein ACLP1Q_04385 [Solirubrobacteraceae bacterium]